MYYRHYSHYFARGRFVKYAIKKARVQKTSAIPLNSAHCEILAQTMLDQLWYQDWFANISGGIT
eukprot:8357385-Lingulodinium_polyedra.AAC.1